jgi:hypothetical protein
MWWASGQYRGAPATWPPPEMAMRSADDEAGAPKYAQIERERRWLVPAGQHPPLEGLATVLIEDRYIIDTRFRLRRMTDTASGRTALKLTRKYEAADPRARPIVTAYLTEAEYDMFGTLPARPISKRRHALPTALGGFSLDGREGMSRFCHSACLDRARLGRL